MRENALPPLDEGHRGLGTAAERALADYLFSTTPVHRLEARGVMRGGWGHGRWVDGALYGRLRENPVRADTR